MDPVHLVSLGISLEVTVRRALLVQLASIGVLTRALVLFVTQGTFPYLVAPLVRLVMQVHFGIQLLERVHPVPLDSTLEPEVHRVRRAQLVNIGIQVLHHVVVAPLGHTQKQERHHVNPADQDISQEWEALLVQHVQRGQIGAHHHLLALCVEQGISRMPV